jgi:hypothetical protein
MSCPSCFIGHPICASTHEIHDSPNKSHLRKDLIMRSLMALLLAGVSIFAQVSTTVPVGNDKEYRINTADYYSWNTRTETYRSISSVRRS